MKMSGQPRVAAESCCTRPLYLPRVEVRHRYGGHGGVPTEWEVSAEGVPSDWWRVCVDRHGEWIAQALTHPSHDEGLLHVSLDFREGAPPEVVLAALELLTRGTPAEELP